MAFDNYFFSTTNEYNTENLRAYLNNVLRMGRVVQGMFYKFKDSYFNRNKKLSEEIILQEDRVDYLESKLEYDGMKLMTTLNLTGIYLKANLTGLKLVYLFENMGDLCEKNSIINLEVLKLPHKINIASFEDIFIISQNCMSLCLKLFSEFINLEKSSLTHEKQTEYFFKEGKKICELNLDINSLFKAYKRNLLKSKEDISIVSNHLEILSNIEEFSDFSTNIIEYIIWAINGVRYKCRANNLEYFYSQDDEI